MRDPILLAALVAVTPFILRDPFVGLLAWIWVTLLMPQREVYGVLAGAGINFYVAALTVVAWFFSREPKRLPPNLFVLALALFAGWTCLTTWTAFDRAFSLVQWDRFIKTFILAIAVCSLANTKARIQAVVWMVVVSLGYYALKGGGFVVLTGGRSHVFGPESSILEDNNNLGLVLVCMLPLMNYLRLTSARLPVRLALLGPIFGAFLAIYGTYSRGALLTLGAALAVYAIRSRSGIVLVVMIGVLATSVTAMLPSKWTNRMSTIQTYNEDASFEGRVAAWKTSQAIAKDRPITGGGFSAVNLTKVARQYPTPGGLTTGRAAHSIYYQVLGDHGFVGLGLYLLMIFAAWVNTFMVLNTTRDRPDLLWAKRLARMLQVSLTAFLVGGAALSMAYYDGVLVVMALSVCLLRVARQPTAEAVARGFARWKSAVPANGPPQPKPGPAAVV